MYQHTEAVRSAPARPADRTALVARLSTELRRRANSSTRDTDRRNEIYQEMMARAWASLPPQATTEDVGIALEAAEDALKEHRLHRRRDRAVHHAHMNENRLSCPDDPESALIVRETMDALFERFEATDRKLVMMSLSGLSISEIQRLTGVPKGTVCARIERTLRACGKRVRTLTALPGHGRS